MSFLSQNTQRSINTDPKKSMRICILVFSAIALICLVVGVMGLNKTPKTLESAFAGDYETGDFIEGTPEYGSTKSFDVKHTLNYLIPMLEEHYYMIYSEDEDTVFFVRANNKFGSNFNFETYENYKKVEVRGTVRKFDYDISRDLKEQLGSDLSERECTYYIDTFSNMLNIMFLVLAGMNILLVAMSVVIFRDKEMAEYDDLQKTRSKAGIVFGVTIFAALLLGLYLLMMTL